MTGRVNQLLSAIKQQIEDELSGDLYPADDLYPSDLLYPATVGAFEAINAVELCGGRFALPEIKRLSKKAPALLISCLEIPATNDGAHGDNEHKLSLVIFVLTRDVPGTTKDMLSVDITERLLRWVKDKEWGLDWTYPVVENISARNLYSNDIDKIGVSLWGVGFKQIIQLECC